MALLGTIKNDGILNSIVYTQCNCVSSQEELIFKYKKYDDIDNYLVIEFRNILYDKFYRLKQFFRGYFSSEVLVSYKEFEDLILKLVEFRKQFNTKEFIPPKSSTKESALFIFDEDLKRNLSITMDIDTSFKDISISLNVQDFNFKRKLKRINHYFEDSMYIKSNDFDYLLTKMYKILNYIKEIV